MIKKTNFLKTTLLFILFFFLAIMSHTNQLFAKDSIDTLSSAKKTIIMDIQVPTFSEIENSKQNLSYLIAQNSDSQSNNNQGAEKPINILWMILGGIILVIFILSKITL